MKNPKTFYIRTYGCQMNELDSSVMAGMLAQRGLTQVDEEKKADILLFNTCSVRDLAERKVMGKIGQLGRSKMREKIIGITGCMANAKKSSLFSKLPHVDFVLGTNNIHDLGSVLDDILEQKTHLAHADKVFHQELDYMAARRPHKHKAYVSIIRGCNKHCTYCIVPYTRGPEVSRDLESIVSESKKLADEGCQEITLLGQNVNSYGKDKPEWKVLFHDLLERLDQIQGLQRVRFLTSHPVDITRELMEAIRDLPSLCEHVHFPLQAGADRVLRKMHRIYTKEEYMEKVALLREIVPSIALGTDMIVGFPSETEEEFQETLEAMEKVQYSNAFLYTYSQRQGTPAVRWKDDIPDEVKQERHQRLLKLHGEISSRLMREMLGQTVEVLVERRNKDARYLKGITRCWRNVIFEGDDSLIGSLQQVTLHSCSHQTLIGSIKSKLNIQS